MLSAVHTPYEPAVCCAVCAAAYMQSCPPYPHQCPCPNCFTPQLPNSSNPYLNHVCNYSPESNNSITLHRDHPSGIILSGGYGPPSAVSGVPAPPHNSTLLPSPTPILSSSPTINSSHLSPNVYVSNLPENADEKWLRTHFSQFGSILSARVMIGEKGQSRGYGFVQFVSPECAAASVNGIHGKVVDGRRLNVKMAHRDKDKGVANQPSTNLYVGNLPSHYRVSDIRALFGPIPVNAVTILKDPQTNISRGVALVRFPSIESATSGILRLNQVLPPGHDRPLEVKYAESQSEKMVRKGQLVPKRKDKSKAKQTPLSPQSQPVSQAHDFASENIPDAPIRFMPPAPKLSERSTVETTQPINWSPALDKQEPNSITLQVFGLSTTEDELALYHLFAPFGALMSARLGPDGCGWVQFATESDAKSAFQYMNGFQLPSGPIRIVMRSSGHGSAGAYPLESQSSNTVGHSKLYHSLNHIKQLRPSICNYDILLNKFIKFFPDS
eukprot:NODE_592_length_2561_cov_26.201395_g507_i0.p1 GENE.NODE_592_length_2561_cov_26.201395_g507_i0~~NODE_592_length_2561_cov_26.201395_g507_i0.p1  ORF type:complete len:517 (-),score=74.48 NODE_592_length_2561_cov_26.201395_g507_i0:1009-2502(-)